MPRATTSLLISIAAHLIVLYGLAEVISDVESTRRQVFEVIALAEPPSPDPPPRPEPPRPMIDPPPLVEPPQRQIVPRRRAARPSNTEPRPAPQPRGDPPEPARSAEPGPPLPSGDASEIVASSPIGSGPSSGAGAGLAERSRRAGGGSAGGGGDGPDPCDAAITAFHRRYSRDFPAWAREMNLTGRLNLSFRVGNDGRPRGIRVSGSTGHGGLDRYARDTARSLGGLPTGCSRQITFSVRFDLRRSSRR